MIAAPEISIIGPGKVGTALGALAARAGWRVVAVAGGSPGRAEAAAEVIGGDVRVCTPAEAAAAGQLVLLTVPDDAVAAVCEELAAAGAFARGAVVAHCCGAWDREILAPARARCGCAVGSMHPLQTFPTVEAAMARLAGAYCFCEGDEEAAGVLERLAEAVGARAVRIDPGGKALYHAAAVMACNYLVALLDAASAVAASAGVDGPTWMAAVEPIVRATVDNAMALGPPGALTGPIARGDAATIRRHGEAMSRTDEPLRAVYAALGRYTVTLARRQGTLDGSAAAAVMDALDRFGTRD